MSDYKPTIGLEIHAELKTQTKMFCGCKNDPDEKRPNLNVCPVCLGHPGVLPTINKEAVKFVIKLGLALGGKIPKQSKFDRKNYFYPDLPKGYQISQYDEPLVSGGELNGVKITRVHLEEDTGRLMHEKEASLVDFNRSSIPLMELVTEPDVKSADEALAFAKELQILLRYLDISDADMEKGQMRVEANISVSKTSELGTKVEVKNINSFSAVKDAIEYELDRQIDVLESGGEITQETRGWSESKKLTFSQRKKESAHDYRYLPEPDLPPLEISEDEIEEIRLSLPELPAAKRERFIKEYQLPAQDAEVLISDRRFAQYFEESISELGILVGNKNLPKAGEEHLRMIKMTANYLMGDIQYLLAQPNAKRGPLADIIKPENFAEFVTIVFEGKTSSAAAKIVLAEMFSTGGDPSNIIEKKELTQTHDEEELSKIVKNVMIEFPKALEDYKKGKTNSIQFLVGKAMAELKGRGNPELLKKLILENLPRR
ncbi:MAG: Asp-tRNA(Asn)/Glu-tRNA(Gln) amidotransferase subunit GatB [Candidatus Colwellbacteria bacterium]|nr:Asp-tRNA(Asn)/Glu-tRNA(Gln) amidotransferase subunit GatB [Candidatus Colwellbacteria bacterium]